MTEAVIHPADLVLTDRLRQRLEELGVGVAAVHADGRVVPLGQVQPLERLIVQSPAFAAGVRRRWDELLNMVDDAVEVWPGVWLVHLPVRRRRRPGDGNACVMAGILLGHDLLESEQIHLLCDQSRVDLQATVSGIDPNRLCSRGEIGRLARTLSWLRQDSLELDRRVGELHTMSQQLAESYEELSLLYKLSSSMTVNQPPLAFLAEACEELQQVVGLRWMALQLARDRGGLNDLAGRTFVAGELPGPIQTVGRVGTRLLHHFSKSPQPVVVDDVTPLGIPELGGLCQQMLLVMLTCEGRPLGILFGGDKVDGSQICSVDSKLCSSLANSMAIFLQNTILFEDMQAMFMGTLHALTSSIDAKDSYTHGHSERVALMSRMLAQAAGLEESVVERVYIAALLHDVGKIGVPEQVLCKPGRLTAEEFAMIRQHPEIGARILQDIKQMQDLIPGVLYHHERWDGRGYPYGLKGPQIPLIGRLIGLADAFDAMSTNRTYREAMDPASVLQEIHRCAGTQFDPQLVQTFAGLDFRPFHEMVRKHQLPPAATIESGGAP